MSSTALTGIFSGIDSETLVAASMAAARGPLNRLLGQRDTWQTKNSAVTEIRRRMAQLQDLVDGLRDMDDLRFVRASSSDTDVLVASATGGATEGVHQVVVDRLATAEKEIHAGVTPTEAWTHSTGIADADDEYLSADDISDAAGENYKFVFQFNGEAQVEVDLSAYDATGITLNQLVTEVNAAAGYTAASAVLEDGQYKLRIEADGVGADHELTITDDQSVTALAGTDEFVQTVDGDVGADTLLGAGQFVYTYDGVTRTITTNAGTDLGQLRDLINNDAQNPGIVASILEYEADADHKFHLVLSGRDMGGDYTIAIDAGTTLADFGPGADWTETQTAQDSRIRVDGYPADPNWIEKSSNTITDVIPGVTLTLYTTGTVNVGLTRDTDQLKTDLGNLVSVYNGIVDNIEEYAGYDDETGTSGVLIGDSSLNLLLGQVRSMLTRPVSGFQSGQDAYTMPAQIGIEIDKDGYLTIDDDTLDEALSDDYFGVLWLIGATGRGASDSSAIQFDSAETSTAAGTYEVEVEFDVDGAITAAHIRTKGETEWRDAVWAGNVITGVAGNDEQGLQLTFAWQSGMTLPQTAEVRVQQGFGGAVYDELEEMLDEIDGPFAIKENRYETAISQLDTRIEAQETRLEAMEERLRAKYARLEATLAQMDSFRAAFDSLLSSLDAMQNANSNR